jgi:hypothetical protein
MSYQYSMSPLWAGQLDHRMPLPSLEQISLDFDRQADQGVSFTFVHGMLFHRDFGHIDVFEWMPPPENSVDHRETVRLVAAYRTTVTTSLLLTIDSNRRDWLRYEQAKCGRILDAFSAAGYEMENES